MLKILPIIFAIILSLSHIQFQKENSLQNVHLASAEPENKVDAVTAVESTPNKNLDVVNTVRLTWNPVVYAVRYRITYGDKTVLTPTTGVELTVKGSDEVFKVTALNFDNQVVAEDVPIVSTEINPKAMRTTSEFDKMGYPPLYVVYSWIPSKNVDHYEIRLMKDNQVVRNFMTEFDSKEENNFDYYDDDPVIEDGSYYWQVRGISADDVAITDWSEKNPGNSFMVTKPARFCSLGDSITHGGAVTVPPSQTFCNWQTYCSLPVKNLGHSGDTTEQILDRFDDDVLPFKPEFLFIMAGVNDFRVGIVSKYSIKNLAAIRDKCQENGITPIFITPTPINPEKIFKTKFVDVPPSDWLYQRNEICDWIRKQKYFIDITQEMSDNEGNLKAYLTTDGLHPDSEGKQIIGKAVEKWLLDNNSAKENSTT